MYERTEEITVIIAAKRLGLAHCPWMGDWFVGYSCRNDNHEDEGTWYHWVQLATAILKHPATKIVAPSQCLPDEFPIDKHCYSGGPVLDKLQIAEMFPDKEY